MKKVLRGLSMLLAVIVLTGCMKMNVNLEINADKSMTGSMQLLMEESMLTAAGMTKEDMVSQMTEELQASEGMENAKITGIEENIDNATWVGVQVDGLNATAEEMQASITEETVDGKDCLVLRLPLDDLKQQMDTESAAMAGYSVDKLKNLGIEMTMTIKMPGNATSNVGTVDGQNVTIDLLDLSANGSNVDELVISSPKSVGMDMTFVYIGIAVLAIIVVIAIILKNKKKTDSNISHDQIEEHATPQQEETKDENVESQSKEDEPVSEETADVHEETQPAQQETSTIDNNENTETEDHSDENNG
ncbi:zinc ribbon domain-containing protein [Massilimicrobiota sp. SW1139]|jgi:lipoprotein|uniref:LppM family (lipo)protein n=1 Tax=Bacillota TaxID=1239 RepID=UPI00143A3136|nr:zinc ribbon domain-containing protein [Massilimicrobiota sp. SW1139]NJE45303.1 zinc ribbon domain-containing protein [Massilimicrobiota sp. SW1139]